jgi:hypothetical protein
MTSVCVHLRSDDPKTSVKMQQLSHAPMIEIQHEGSSTTLFVWDVKIAKMLAAAAQSAAMLLEAAAEDDE